MIKPIFKYPVTLLIILYMGVVILWDSLIHSGLTANSHVAGENAVLILGSILVLRKYLPLVIVTGKQGI